RSKAAIVFLPPRYTKRLQASGRSPFKCSGFVTEDPFMIEMIAELMEIRFGDLSSGEHGRPHAVSGGALESKLGPGPTFDGHGGGSGGESTASEVGDQDGGGETGRETAGGVLTNAGLARRAGQA